MKRGEQRRVGEGQGEDGKDREGEGQLGWELQRRGALGMKDREGQGVLQHFPVIRIPCHAPLILLCLLSSLIRGRTFR